MASEIEKKKILHCLVLEMSVVMQIHQFTPYFTIPVVFIIVVRLQIYFTIPVVFIIVVRLQILEVLKVLNI